MCEWGAGGVQSEQHVFTGCGIVTGVDALAAQATGQQQQGNDPEGFAAPEEGGGHGCP